MKTIHKHPLPMPGETLELDLSAEARVVTMQFMSQDKSLYMWVELPTDVQAKTQKRKFRVFKTGDGVPDVDIYRATAIDHYFPEAYHLYEIP
ncbi:MAG: hypothetical protein V4629_01995 [Pseudomonadota bacterium]